VRRPELITECARVFGAQCIVAAIDVRRAADGSAEVWIDRGTERTAWPAAAWAREVEARGAGEIFLTSIDREGTGRGYDVALVRDVVEAVSVPVIAFGGVSTWPQLVEGLTVGGADAVSAANVFHFTEQSTRKAKDHLRAAGIDVR
jgi:cyclase